MDAETMSDILDYDHHVLIVVQAGTGALRPRYSRCPLRLPADEQWAYYKDQVARDLADHALLMILEDRTHDHPIAIVDGQKLDHGAGAHMP